MIGPEVYESLAEECAIRLSCELIEKSNRYLELLQKWRKRISLMSDRAFDEVVKLHLFEAYWAAHHHLTDHFHVADIGSGAGFPGLASTIYRPSLDTLLIESNRKKSVFLETASRELKVRLKVFPDRAENFSGWDSIQIVTARAITPSIELLRILEKEEIELLLFHGAEYQPLPTSWKLLKKELFPLSSNRWISHFAPPGKSCFT